MSSPGRPSDRMRSSPSRRRINGAHRNSQTDSRSAQLIEELLQLLLDDDRSFKKQLDEQSQAQQRHHVEALERALAQHEAVRKSAEHTFEAIQLEVERQRIAREAEERRRMEEQRQKLIEEQEAAKRQEEEQRRRAEEERQRRGRLEREREEAAARDAARKKEEEAAKARDKAAQEQAARERAEAEQRARDEAAAREASQRQAQSQGPGPAAPAAAGAPLETSIGPAAVSTLSSAKPNALLTTEQDRMKVHETYLRIHRRLKVLREEVDGLKQSQSHDEKNMYQRLRDDRQRITMTMGQLLKGEENKSRNMEKIRLLKQLWQESSNFFPHVVVDINEFRAEPVPRTMVPKCFVYMVSHTVKAIIKQMGQDAATDPAFADVIGVLTAQVFSGTTQLSGGYPMSDVLLAKFNKVHPVMFGKLGSEKSQAGLKALGWDLERHGGKEEAFPRFVGMSRCFAAITLRDFSRAKTQVNPFPNRIFWETVARLLNTPTEDQLTIQYLTLQGLLDPAFVEKFIQHYGNMALAILRVAVQDFPARRPPDNNTIKHQATTLASFYDRYELELNLHL